MSGRNPLRRLVPVLVVAALVAGLAAPAHARPAFRQSAAVGLSSLGELWTYVSRLWSGGVAGSSASHGLRSLFGAEGASLDPHGNPTPAAGSGAGGGTAVTHGEGGA
ncbi:MAG TPA: hypothetical protein VGR07_18265 [Thermoanaerobaculia bacterium]|jgi:hypothetical protein|nr:hypothetical protein [Thermoanaerobaculia bacterium]